MPGTLTLFHTAQVHCASFDALRDRIAPGVPLRHEVRADWLARAQDGIGPALADEIAWTIARIDGPVICTCTTIGESAESAGAIRIDRPMMRAAAQGTGTVLMAYCLDSTRDPSLALLRAEMDRAGNPAAIRPLPLTHLWPLFEAGNTGAFAAAIAGAVTEALAVTADPGSVVLAQASMAGAADALTGLPVPVLASPALALEAGLARL